jgi:hypothetical protein
MAPNLMESRPYRYPVCKEIKNKTLTIRQDAKDSKAMA